MARNYKHEDAIESPRRKADRAERMRADRAWEKQHGPIPKGEQLDHKKPLSEGGTNAKTNLRPIPAHDNESYKRTGPGGKQVGSAKPGGLKK